jgi:hypothetical protein
MIVVIGTLLNFLQILVKNELFNHYTKLANALSLTLNSYFLALP